MGVREEQEKFSKCFEVFLDKFSICGLALLKGKSVRTRNDDHDEQGSAGDNEED